MIHKFNNVTGITWCGQDTSRPYTAWCGASPEELGGDGQPRVSFYYRMDNFLIMANTNPDQICQACLNHPQVQLNLLVRSV